MPLVQYSPRVTISYPDDWPSYRKQVIEDKNRFLKALRLPEIQQEDKLFTTDELEGLVCDTSGTLLDYEPIPGIEVLLKALREKAGFKKIKVASGGSDPIRIIERALGKTDLVDNFVYVEGSKRNYAATNNFTFVLEDDDANENTPYLLSAITPYRQVWNMGRYTYVHPREYDEELVNDIAGAFSSIKTELEKL